MPAVATAPHRVLLWFTIMLPGRIASNQVNRVTGLVPILQAAMTLKDRIPPSRARSWRWLAATGRITFQAEHRQVDGVPAGSII